MVEFNFLVHPLQGLPILAAADCCARPICRGVARRNGIRRRPGCQSHCYWMCSCCLRRTRAMVLGLRPHFIQGTVTFIAGKKTIVNQNCD
jgi:hypothetical protein